MKKIKDFNNAITCFTFKVSQILLQKQPLNVQDVAAILATGRITEV